MDNLSFTRLDVPPEWFTAGLDQGHAPIGHLLDKLFIKRGNVTVSNEVKKLLWEAVGAPDSNASRSYQISTQDNTFMLIFEVFRGAMTHQIT